MPARFKYVAEHAVRETRGEADRSFERLYRLHHGDVYGASLRELGNVHDAEDATQAAFVDAYRALLRGSHPDSPRAWLLAIAENARRRRFRTGRRRPAEEPAEFDALPAPELPHEQAQALRAALQSLPQLQREVFLLREIRGLTYDEIAERTGSSVGSVQMLLFRARRTLRAELEPPIADSRRSAALSWPAWLLEFLGRADRLGVVPRGAGAAAAALVLGGSTAGLVQLGPEFGHRSPLPGSGVRATAPADTRPPGAAAARRLAAVRTTGGEAADPPATRAVRRQAPLLADTAVEGMTGAVPEVVAPAADADSPVRPTESPAKAADAAAPRPVPAAETVPRLGALAPPRPDLPPLPAVPTPPAQVPQSPVTPPPAPPTPPVGILPLPPAPPVTVPPAEPVPAPPVTLPPLPPAPPVNPPPVPPPVPPVETPPLPVPPVPTPPIPVPLP